MRKEITLYEVETLQDVRLNGAEVAAGKIVSVTEQIKNIWLSKGICKLPEIKKEPEIIKTPKNISEEKPEFPKSLSPGRWELSNGKIIQGKKAAAIEAENALKG